MIKTNQAIVRAFTMDDLDDFSEFCMQEDVGVLAGWKPHENKEESLKRLNKQIEDPNSFAIEYIENGKVIGQINIHEDLEDGDEHLKELGFALNKEYHRRHIMQEVVNEVVKYLFNNGVTSIYACCIKENAASRKLIESCGFTFDAEGSFYSKSLNKKFDSYEYVIQSAC